MSAEFGAIVEDSRLLTGILDDLLISADPRTSVDHTVAELVSVARNAVALVASQAEQQSIALEQSGGAEPVMVQGSPAALSRVFTAHISNALDHARTVVNVDVSTRAGEACIEV